MVANHISSMAVAFVVLGLLSGGCDESSSTTTTSTTDPTPTPAGLTQAPQLSATSLQAGDDIDITIRTEGDNGVDAVKVFLLDANLTDVLVVDPSIYPDQDMLSSDGTTWTLSGQISSLAVSDTYYLQVWLLAEQDDLIVGYLNVFTDNSGPISLQGSVSLASLPTSGWLSWGMATDGEALVDSGSNYRRREISISDGSVTDSDSGIGVVGTDVAATAGTARYCVQIYTLTNYRSSDPDLAREIYLEMDPNPITAADVESVNLWPSESFRSDDLEAEWWVMRAALASGQSVFIRVIDIDPTPADTIYAIKVRDFCPAAESFAYGTTRDHDIYEPDDTDADATPLIFDTIQAHTLWPNGADREADHFTFTAP